MSASTAGELLISFDGAAKMEVSPIVPLSARDTALSMINTLLKGYPHTSGTWMPPYQLNRRDLATLDRFWSRTILTMGTEETRSLFQRESCRLASMVGDLSLFRHTPVPDICASLTCPLLI